ncbi:catalase [Bathymodiolus thermophilus thioautotrophic gill symbiont]|uniref:catalase n=1 Tax=Bathymodiolus thermophilus thioautotrophic gill symbiont TaxID=2360 RepID=A0A1J5UG64_9GAMM|nr:catalase [Bathymodiolus thermophilus thioautotrophic gill symbiont]OIR24917.1 catalase [Bathymodiolus thermophilus thioautotrophic gill symbiont]CAB5504727.1 Catalase KatE (EC [Bathymodiolus thermophilus thioautotrophic gill symbiont]
MNKKILTNVTGSLVADDNNSITIGERGALTFDNHYAFEKLAHFNRERIPERVVHARGTGAYGVFTVTKSLKDKTIANFLQTVGQETQIFARFSTVGGGQDSSDYARDPRGFALKFYTNEGNYDMVGNNTPVFFLRDGINFPDFIHSQKKNPRTNMPDPAAMYEFWANHPQSLHQITILMSDRGIPASYRYMHGFSSHTFSFWNGQGKRIWFKWHFKTNQGIKNLTNEQAVATCPFGAQEDLVNAIEQGNFPSWTAKVQMMSEKEAKNYKINPFDLTKIWPHVDFPLIEVGQLELNRNVDNYFAETEQSCFSPGNLVPGIGASPDKMLQARLMAYPDAHRYRVGANANQLPVNAAKCPVNHYQRDGKMAGICPVGGNQIQTGKVNFYPNSQINNGAPVPIPTAAEPPMPVEQDAWVKRYDTVEAEDYYQQAGDLFRLMSESQKSQLTTTIAEGLSQATTEVQQKMFAQFNRADSDYALRIKIIIKNL